MAIRLRVVSACGSELDIYQLSSGLSAAINPAHRDALPFEGSDIFKTASGVDVHQCRPGVFVVAGSSTEYQRIAAD